MFLVSLLEAKMIPKEIVALAQQTLRSSTGRRNLDELPEDYMQLIIKKISVSCFSLLSMGFDPRQERNSLKLT